MTAGPGAGAALRGAPVGGPAPAAGGGAPVGGPAPLGGGAGRVVHVVLPGDIDDPATPSGGNTYDRRVCLGLAASGWTVHEHPVAGAWPAPAAEARGDLAGRLRALPDQALVLVDGLVASAVPEVLLPQARRLRLVALVHLPLGHADPALRPQERRAMATARAVIVTSAWSRQRLLSMYGLPASRVHVVAPGVDPAPVAAGSARGGRLLCVAAVARHKGHDTLVAALERVSDLRWRCDCVGSLDRDPEFVAGLRQRLAEAGLAGRVRLTGPRTGTDLAASYAGADLLVHASLGETYGMVVTEALARAVPVVATAVHGLPEAMGRLPGGALPGALVPASRPSELAGALRQWLTDPQLRQSWRQRAAARRRTLGSWAYTAGIVANVLDTVATTRRARP